MSAPLAAPARARPRVGQSADHASANWPTDPAALGSGLKPDAFAGPVSELAPALVGCALVVDGPAGPVGGVIVETERYQQDDPASHSFRGLTPRTAVMFGPPGRLYVYRSYGIHWCVNLVCEPEGRGAAVLLRALRPLWGLPAMRARRAAGRTGSPGRPAPSERLLAAGPGRLSQALGVDGGFDGRALGDGVRLLPRRGPVALARGPRIGVSRAAERPWRFGIAASPYLSRPLRPR